MFIFVKEKLKKNLIKILQNKGISKIFRIFGRTVKGNIIYFIRDDINRNYAKILAENTKYDIKSIENLLNKIELVQRNVHCAHGQYEFYVMQAMILNLPIDGPIIELGCYKGGSTAKLSLICKLTGRELYAFDSFEGLPAPSKQDLKHEYTPIIYPKKSVSYVAGEYTGSLEEVKRNVSKFGSIEICKFIKGRFEDTLPNFNVKPACIFMDVDYIESARTAIKFLWPRLSPGGLFFSHESGVLDFIKAITDQDWWKKEMNQPPPLIYGAGYGTCWRYNKIAFPSNIMFFKKLI